jgi:hypothetical protein
MSDSSWSSGIPRFPAVIDAEERGSDIGTEAEDNFAAEERRSALIRGKSLRAFLPSDRLRVIPLGLNHRAAVYSVFGRIIRVYQYSSVATLHYDPPPLLPSDHCTCLYQYLSVATLRSDPRQSVAIAPISHASAKTPPGRQYRPAVRSHHGRAGNLQSNGRLYPDFRPTDLRIGPETHASQRQRALLRPTILADRGDFSGGPRAAIFFAIAPIVATNTKVRETIHFHAQKKPNPGIILFWENSGARRAGVPSRRRRRRCNPRENDHDARSPGDRHRP